MKQDNPAFLTIAELEPLIGAGQLSPVELVDACLERIHSLDNGLHAFITVTEESARQAALKAETAIVEGEHLGPLHGIPVGLKDLYWTEEIPTTAGSKIKAGYVPPLDATSVALLKNAGTIILGKMNMHPFAYGAVGINPDYGTPRNPWNTVCIPGGSSSGSAVALATGMVTAATGSDTGGSIRIPSSICGTVGIKPTYGRVSRHGVVPLSWSLDHAGPMARSVEDCAILLQAMAAHDPQDPTSSNEPVPDYRAAAKRPVAGLRGAVPRGFFTGVQDGVRAAVEEALKVLEGLGMHLEEVDAPDLDETVAVSMAILGPEAAAYHKEMLQEVPDQYPADVLRRLQTNFFIPAVDYVRGQQLRTSLAQRYYDILRRYDVLVTPTEPLTAQPIGQTTVVIGGEERSNQGMLTRFTSPFNITGLPAISVPCGFDERGLPVGLQVAGRPFEEGTVLRVAFAYEQATPWHAYHPQILTTATDG